MPTDEMHSVFNKARLDDRQVTELVGLCRGLIADGAVSDGEAKLLQTWLAANAGVTGNPVVCNLLKRISAMLKDGHLDDDEAVELYETLSKFTGGKLELGEVLKSTELPFDEPLPDLKFVGSRYCFTGTFAFGPRKDCDAAVERLGGIPCSLTLKTNYLVVGQYATESWIQSTYGRKIERAVEMKSEGHLIAIVGEAHWVQYLRSDSA